MVAGIARRFVAAGADILATNTFNANRISQADYGAEALVGDINRAAARIIREVVDEASAADGQQRWVAGAIGPTNKTLSLSPDVNDPGFREVDFDEVKAVYREQIDALVEGGIDFVLIETVFDTLNCKAAIMAALEAEAALGRELPIMISMTLTDLSRPQPVGPHGRGLLGQRPPCPAADDRAQLLVRRGPASPAPRRAVGAAPTRWSWPIPMPGCPTSLANMTRPPPTPPRRSREWFEEGWSTSSAAAAAPRPTISPRSPRRRRAGPPRAIPAAPTRTVLAGLEPMVLAA